MTPVNAAELMLLTQSLSQTMTLGPMHPGGGLYRRKLLYTFTGLPNRRL